VPRSPGRPVLAGLVLLCLLSASTLGAQTFDEQAAQNAEPASARSALEAYTTGLDRLSARFLQRVVSPDGEIMDEGEGTLWMQRPDRFRWYYEGEFPELIVADGDRVWIYDESLEQVNVRIQDTAAGTSPLLLLTDLSGLDEAYQVTELGTLSGSQLLQLQAKDAEAPFERLVLAMENGELTRLVLEDSFGLRTELSFSDLERNPTLPPGHFVFEPPEGVDLLGDVPARYRSSSSP